jgi:hypothetical protein
MTPPMITLTKERIGFFEIGFFATASDNTSGVWYIEVYSDDVLIRTDFTPPFVFSYVVSVFEKHTVKVIAYDVAGNNASSSTVTPCIKRQSYNDNYFSVPLVLRITKYKTVAVSNCMVEELEYDRVICNDFFIDAFIQESRKDHFGIIYFNATIVYTTEFHRFYTGEMEITGFRGVITPSFICGFYNDGW